MLSVVLNTIVLKLIFKVVFNNIQFSVFFGYLAIIMNEQESSTRLENEVKRLQSTVPPSNKGKGRKKQRNPPAWEKNIKKRKRKQRDLSKCLPELPACLLYTSRCV